MKLTDCLLGLLLLAIVGCAPTTQPMTNQDEANPWVIRTEFSNDGTWTAIREQIAAPQTEMGYSFYAHVRYVSDQQFAGMQPKELVHALPDDYPGFFCFVADDKTFASNEHPILVVGFSPDSLDIKDYERTPSQTPLADIKSFRAVPATIQGIENNLSISNMDFEEFADTVDADGVFRGFAP